MITYVSEMEKVEAYQIVPAPNGLREIKWNDHFPPGSFTPDVVQFGIRLKAPVPVRAQSSLESEWCTLSPVFEAGEPFFD
jgi:hypothetical protein